MKYLLLGIALLYGSDLLFAQTNYPEPEFSKEVYYLKKDSVRSLVRLEKSSSKMETKTKMGGFGGMENGYEIEGGKSTTRLGNGNLSFVISTGASSMPADAKRDSMMRANGMDPATMKESYGSMNDPSNTISLYKVEAEKGNRKILLQKSPGAMPFGSKKTKSSDKLTLSIKKIREGYWELIVDKPLAKGEYAFTMMSMTDMNGGILVFAFGVD